MKSQPFSTGLPMSTEEMQAQRARAWKPEQVPIGALFKFCPNAEKIFEIIAVAPKHGSIKEPAIIVMGEDAWDLNFEYLQDASTSKSNPIHSTDGGKTWKPCYNE